MDNHIRIISLQPLYDFINKISARKDLLSALRDRKDYGLLCKELVKPIDRCQGFYLWGTYHKKGLWTNIYLGKAGLGKTANLRNRILEELKKERVCFWRTKSTEIEIKTAGKELHRKMWRKYNRNSQRAFLKAGSTHIVWVPMENLSNKDVLRVEADLIEAMNPRANVMRPNPPANLQEDTRDVFEQMRFSIHAGRDTRFSVKIVNGLKRRSGLK